MDFQSTEITPAPAPPTAAEGSAGSTTTITVDDVSGAPAGTFLSEPATSTPAAASAPADAPAEPVAPAPADKTAAAAPADAVDPPAPEAPAAPAPDAFLEQATGGKLKTADDLRAALTDPTTLLPESERALLAHIRAGGSLTQIGAVLDRDWKATSDFDVVKAAWDEAHPEYADAEIRELAWDRYVNEKFPNALSDDDTDAAVRYDKLHLGKQAATDRAAFEAKQATFRALPTPAAKGAEAQQADAAAAEAEAAFAAAWDTGLNQHLQDLKSLPFAFETPAGQQTAALDVSDLTKEEREAIGGNFDTMLSRWMPDGKRLDPAKVTADLLALTRLPKLLALAAEQGRAAEASDQMRRRLNPADNPNDQASGSSSLEAQLAASALKTAGPSRY